MRAAAGLSTSGIGINYRRTKCPRSKETVNRDPLDAGPRQYACHQDIVMISNPSTTDLHERNPDKSGIALSLHALVVGADGGGGGIGTRAECLGQLADAVPDSLEGSHFQTF